MISATGEMSRLNFRTKQLCFSVAFAAITGGNIFLFTQDFADKGAYYAGNITLLLMALKRFGEVRREIKKSRENTSRLE
jgi:hypothetical protein